jgi:hypothetical protein
MAKNRAKPVPAPSGDEGPKRRAINARLPDPLADALEAYLASLRPAPTATAVTLVAIEEFLERKGFWPPGSTPSDKE